MGRPICHRALHNAKAGISENSKEAIEAAIEVGLPIEVDVQNTSDARAVVFHDRKLNRLTNKTGQVRDRTLDEMKAIPLKMGGHTISLRELCELVDGRIPVLVEVKDQDGHMGPDLGTFLPDIVEIARDYAGPFALMSFNPYIVQALKAELPDTPIGLTTDKFTSLDWPRIPKDRRRRLRKRQEIEGLEYDFVSHNVADLKRVADLDVPKLCWTVKSPRQEDEALGIADNITFEGYRPAGL